MPIVAFARWDPVRDLLAIQQRLDRFAPRPWAGFSIDVPRNRGEYVSRRSFRPAADDIHIQVTDSRLQISGERRERAAMLRAYHRSSVDWRLRPHVRVSAAGPMAITITADLRDGVLTVICPKAAEGSARAFECPDL